MQAKETRASLTWLGNKEDGAQKEVLNGDQGDRWSAADGRKGEHGPGWGLPWRQDVEVQAGLNRMTGRTPV